MQTLLQDLRYGARMLIRKPGFTAVAVLTLALGIGANTAIFSVVNAVLLNSLPFKDPERLTVVFSKTSRDPRNYVTYPDLQDWRAQSKSFTELSAWVPQSVNLIGREEPTRVVGGFVSADFFKMLGVEAAHGRVFLPGEDQPGAERVVVVGHEVWQNQLGADPNLIGQALNLNGQVFTVVGILPAGFHFTLSDSDVWLPIQCYPNYSLDRARTSEAVVGRLKAGVTLQQAQSEMETIAGRLAEQYPDTNKDRSVSLVSLQELVTENLKPRLLVMSGAVAFLLLIACANVANLMLARSVARQREIALRAALGAGRWRLVRLLLVESLLIALAGGISGMLIAIWSLDWLMSGSPVELPDGITVKFDATVLGFTFAITCITAVAFGLAPSLRFSRPDLNEVLKEGGKGASESSSKLRGALVVSQIALALVLLIGSMLLVQSFRALLQVNPGFNPKNLLTMEYRVPRSKYPEPAQQWAFHKQVVEHVRALPDVKEASVVLALPQSGNGGMAVFIPLDRPAPARGEEPRANTNRADPYYFSTMGIPLLRGRVFTEQDKMDSRPVVVINKALAERYWPGQDPVDKVLRLPEFNLTATIVGVVGNIKHNSLDEPVESQVYLAFAQAPFIFATLVVRTAGDPAAAANEVKRAVWSVDKDQPVWKVRTMESLLQRALNGNRFMTYLHSVFSGIALLLASVGIYGVISYSVSQRTRELGVRIALGAQRGDIIRLVVRQGLALTVIGAGAGLIMAAILTRYMTALLFNVSPTDPLIFAGLALFLGLVAFFASYLPARRAAMVDPMVALRNE